MCINNPAMQKPVEDRGFTPAKRSSITSRKLSHDAGVERHAEPFNAEDHEAEVLALHQQDDQRQLAELSDDEDYDADTDELLNRVLSDPVSTAASVSLLTENAHHHETHSDTSDDGMDHAAKENTTSVHHTNEKHENDPESSPNNIEPAHEDAATRHVPKQPSPIDHTHDDATERKDETSPSTHGDPPASYTSPADADTSESGNMLTQSGHLILKPAAHEHDEHDEHAVYMQPSAPPRDSIDQDENTFTL